MLKNKKIKYLIFAVFIAILILIPTQVDVVHASWLPNLGFDIKAIVSTAIKEVVAFFAAMAMTIAGFILGIAGLFLDEVLKYTVVEMSAHLLPAFQPGAGLYVGWSVFRDVANMFFIFIILYIAIGTILRLDSVDTKKLLVHVILIALLLNFSLFFTKVIIDASNILSINFYDSLTSGAFRSISEAFMQPMGLTSFYTIGDNITGAQALLSDANQGWFGVLLLGVFGVTFFLVTAFVFLAAALMFVMRYVILINLIFLSPLAFLAMALPKDEYSSKWWKALFSQALFAPVFLALLWAMLTGIEVFMGNVAPTASFIQLATAPMAGQPPMEVIPLLVIFSLNIFGMLAAIAIAREISQSGGGAITQLGQHTVSRWASDFGGTIARQTIGRPARAIHEAATHTRLFQGQMPVRIPRILGGNTKVGKAISKGLEKTVGKAVGGLAESTMEATVGSVARQKFGTRSAYDTHEENKSLKSRVDAIKDKKKYNKAVLDLERKGVAHDNPELAGLKAKLEVANKQIKDTIYTPRIMEGRDNLAQLEKEFKLLREALHAATGKIYEPPTSSSASSTTTP